MTLSQFLSDIYDSLRVSEAHAEAAAGSADTMMESQIQSESERKQVKEDADTSGKDDSDKEEDTPAEEEEEEEEEPEDPLPAIEEGMYKLKWSFVEGSYILRVSCFLKNINGWQENL